MAFASGSRAQLNYVPEEDWGTTPGTPAMKKIRYTTESLEGSIEQFQSQEIRGDRMIASVSQGAVDVRGGFNFELSYAALDAFLAAALWGAWDVTTKKVTASTLTLVASTKKIEDAAEGLDAFEVGDLITVSGSADNDGYYTVAAVDAGGAFLTVNETLEDEGKKISGTGISFASATKTIADSALGLDVFEVGDTIIVTGSTLNDGTYTVATVEADGSSLTVSEALADEAAGESVIITSGEEITVSCEFAEAGVTEQSFTLEKWFTDIEKGVVFRGCLIDTLSLEVRPNAIITGAIGVSGKEQEFTSAALGTPTAVALNDPFEGSDQTMVIKEGGAVIGLVTGLTLNLANNLSGIYVVGSNVKADIAEGRSNLTGTVTALFQDLTLLNKWLNKTASSLDIILTDVDGNKLRIYIPNIEYSGSTPQVGGENEILLNMPFQALMDATLGTTIVLQR